MILRHIHVAILTLAVWLSAAIGVHAQNTSPVVVELYTSQGCSSCPPADAMLHELAARDDVIALALHVDYWDYIGWKDSFASPEHSKRQRRYAVVAGRRSVYTPQMIVGGTTSVVGAKAMAVADAIGKHRAMASPVSVSLARNGDHVMIRAQNSGSAAPMVVQMVRYTPKEKVRITRGENAGHHLSYAHVVRDWRVLAEWSGQRDLQIEADAAGDEPVVVLIQASGQGPILAAAQLR